MTRRREVWALAVAAVVALAALLDIVYIMANDMACQAPNRAGCVQISFWTLAIPCVIVGLALLCSGIGYFVHRRDPD